MPKSIYFIASDAYSGGVVPIAQGDIWVRTAPGLPIRKLTLGQATEYFALEGLDFSSPNVRSMPGTWFIAAINEDNAAAAVTLAAHPWMS